MIDKYLEFISSIDSKIENKLYERNKWYDIAKGTAVNSDGERVRSSGVSNKQELAVINYVELDKQIDDLKRQKQEFIDRIERLQFNYYNILHDVYIKGYKPKQSARMRNKSESWGKSTHRKAKKELEKVMEEEKCTTRKEANT